MSDILILLLVLNPIAFILYSTSTKRRNKAIDKAIDRYMRRRKVSDV